MGDAQLGNLQSYFLPMFKKMELVIHALLVRQIAKIGELAPCPQDTLPMSLGSSNRALK